MNLHVSIMYGSVRSERQGIKAALFFQKKLQQLNIETTLIDPLKTKLPLLDKMHKEYEEGKAPNQMESISKTLNQSDGFLLISGEYNHSIPPALKNLLDHFQREYFFKPSAIVSYSAGNYAGVRAAVHLRAILAELGTPSISSMFPIAQIQNAFNEHGNALDSFYDERSQRFLDEFIWYMNALKKARNNGIPY